MPSYELTGKVKTIMDQQTFGSGFTKREFVVTTEDKFPQDIKFECVKDKCALLDNVKEGQEVAVSFDLRGNEYNGRYFVNVTAWRVEAAKTSDAQAGPADDERPINQFQEPQEEEYDDNMPF